MSSSFNISGAVSYAQANAYAKALVDQQQAGQAQQASAVGQLAASTLQQASTPGPSNQAVQIGFSALAPAPQPATQTGSQPALARPFQAGGHAERNNQGTQGAGSAAPTPTVATYGATAVTAVNGTTGGGLDLLA